MNGAYFDVQTWQYSPSLRRWLMPNPLSEKYYDVSPYVYCNDNYRFRPREDSSRMRERYSERASFSFLATFCMFLSTRL